jgi:excinuclease ABC subunit B
MGIATWHEVKPVQGKRPRKPVAGETASRGGSKIFQPTNSRESGPEFGPAPRSTGGAPGHRGGWKKR